MDTNLNMNPYAKHLQDIWFTHPVKLAGKAKRTAYGVVPGEAQTVQASVAVNSRVVTNQAGEDVTVAGTVCWPVDGPVPEIGDKLTLPDIFGMKPNREVVTVQVADSGTGMTPDHVAVTFK